jgi:hypothetical protein
LSRLRRGEPVRSRLEACLWLALEALLRSTIPVARTLLIGLLWSLLWLLSLEVLLWLLIGLLWSLLRLLRMRVGRFLCVNRCWLGVNILLGLSHRLSNWLGRRLGTTLTSTRNRRDLTW